MTTPPPAEIIQEKSIQTSMTGNKNEPSPSTKGTEEALQAMAEERKKKVGVDQSFQEVNIEDGEDQRSNCGTYREEEEG
ncbi:hypothetical protein Tco_0884849 [Tanacetum coccineum]